MLAVVVHVFTKPHVQYTMAWMKRLVLHSKQHCVWHCHLTIQSNTVSSFCVQVNACKRQWVSRSLSKKKTKPRLWKAMDILFWSLKFIGVCSHETRGKYSTVNESTNTADTPISWLKHVKRASIRYKLTLAARHKQYFSHSRQYEPPKANMSSKAVSWAKLCLWLLMGSQPIFTWQIQWSERVLKRQKVRILLLGKFHFPIMRCHGRRAPKPQSAAWHAVSRKTQ